SVQSSGIQGGNATVPTAKQPVATPAPTPTPTPTPNPYIEVINAPQHLPVAAGVEMLGSAAVTIDVSNSGQGYIMAQYTGGSGGKVKFRITGPDDRLYTYNLHGKVGWQTFILTGGSGTYTFQTFEQASGDEYYLADSSTAQVAIEDEFLPFLYPNQFVNYNENSLIVPISVELAQN
ncbi:MAG: hypothetical protein RR902_06475, partial [Oscillospiraceae bacterium]